MNKHTQGKWKDTFNTAKERGVRTSSGYICFLPKPSHYSGQDERYERELEENKANAKLISAAPELLELVENSLFYFSNEANYPEGTIGYQFAQKAKAAIKKATEGV